MQVLTLLGMHADDVGATLQQLRELALVRAGLSEADVAAALQQRAEARQAKDFARGDEIRVQLAAKGVLVMDTPQGSTWRPGLVQQQA
jgi:cysteinyl-tRNA synthetase